MSDLPAPPVPPDCDLRQFPDMPMEVASVRDCDFRRRSNGDEFKAGILLWCSSWHQVPCGSLPDDDIELADFAGLGTGKPAVRSWQKIRPMAMRGWYKASDGRLYHPRMAEKALMCWKAKQAQREKTIKARIASLSKQVEAEVNPHRKASLESDLGKAQQELSAYLSRIQSHPPVTAPVTGVLTGVLTGSKGREEKGREEKGSEGKGIGEPPATEAQDHMDLTSPPGPTAPTTEGDRFRYEVQPSPWFQALKAVRAKIGPDNWRGWKGLVDAHGIDAVTSAAKSVPSDVRWDDRTEKVLMASRGQSAPSQSIAHKIRKI